MKITDENYVSLTIDYLSELLDIYHSAGMNKYHKDLEKLIKYLNKTN